MQRFTGMVFKKFPTCITSNFPGSPVVRVAEWSKAPDSSSGPRMWAWVQIPLLTQTFFSVGLWLKYACAKPESKVMIRRCTAKYLFSTAAGTGIVDLCKTFAPCKRKKKCLQNLAVQIRLFQGMAIAFASNCIHLSCYHLYSY